MPILPIIDLHLFVGWSCLAAGALLKAIYVTTRYRPDVLGLGPMEFMMISGIFLLFALTLAARTYVKASEPGMLAKKRAASALRAASDAKTENDAAVAEAKANNNNNNNGLQAEKAAGSRQRRPRVPELIRTGEARESSGSNRSRSPRRSESG